MDKACVETVRLLLATTPDVFHAPCFALKGSTALNLFVQEMPRLSVDLDVVYVPHATERSAARRDSPNLKYCHDAARVLLSRHDDHLAQSAGHSRLSIG